MKKVEIQNLVKELSAYDSNYDNYIMTKQDISILADELLVKINNTLCCTELKRKYTIPVFFWLNTTYLKNGDKYTHTISNSVHSLEELLLYYDKKISKL